MLSSSISNGLRGISQGIPSIVDEIAEDRLQMDRQVKKHDLQDIRSSAGKKKWDKERFQYALCPVTKALLHRLDCCVPCCQTNLDKADRSIEIAYDVFVSHASKDKEAVLRIVEDLKEAGITYWVDHEQITFTDFITDKIEEGLRRSRFVLVCLSNNLGRSNWCRREYGPIINRCCKGNTEKKVSMTL